LLLWGGAEDILTQAFQVPTMSSLQRERKVHCQHLMLQQLRCSSQHLPCFKLLKPKQSSFDTVMVASHGISQVKIEWHQTKPSKSQSYQLLQMHFGLCFAKA